uniref:PPIase cyclophilin-type domain-containing protein n=2 Tax=Chaetoceros debilis TaxID=122233 RepID=A0A7S3PVD6_9STRA|mmetsp:Transcript_12161/g.18376  ORF Transcript_12161/g.18376 Transcript_12161/m.18376 type:complete len:339 (+) Transcript_12161:90-1106(+)|eukprot:CAMPEP_0194098386 /NCGR_PEP_ID=MMETSP0149-20130528/58348_1 /TAXON_ID=122233 /ORGANISM="Chaetoceros debilis, Strain MM31A-1" /LENGTH=338 /DNA_ID=CAMNT_0038784431 /DNA_START=85 /DNA_END=1101 /DNA_ORIENTATION=-
MYQSRRGNTAPNNVYAEKKSAGKGSIITLVMMIVGLICFSMFQYNALGQGVEHLHEQELNMQGMEMAEEEKIKQLQDQLKAVEIERDVARQKRSSLEKELKQHPVTEKGNSGDSDTKKALQTARDQFLGLEKSIQKRSKIDAIEKFGPGPHRVKIDIEFHPDEVPEGTEDSFIIEMAPLGLMPYTVNFFLEQVHRGHYDGCSFHRNAGHVVQGGPVENHLTKKGVNVRKPFSTSGYSSMAFQEYHKDFPHEKYTLGYAGRPGGPDFYVSVQDNTRNHGPGGQASYKVKSEADPCFAKVVEGHAAVDRMHTLSKQPGDYARMVHYVAIKKMSILDNNDK